MNKAERKVIQTIYMCVEQINRLYPTNPADIARLASGFKKIHGETRTLMSSLFDLKVGDIEEAQISACEALKGLQ